jgi:3-oxoacyl-[acyl-carrier protein] reductase
LLPQANWLVIVRNVIVTGGSRGLGLSVARRLSCEGYRAIVIARQMSDQLADAMARADETRAGSMHFMPFDLCDVQNIPTLVKTLHDTEGPIYGLVNNAAIGFDGALALMPNAKIERLIRLNTVSPIMLTKYVVRHMMADGGGRVVNVASIIGFTGYSGLSVYGATKASMIGFTRSLAREVGTLEITVNAIAPGFMDTDMTKGLDSQHREKVAHRSALRRLAEVEDVAGAIEFLLGPNSKNITGTVLTVDAGATA